MTLARFQDERYRQAGGYDIQAAAHGMVLGETDHAPVIAVLGPCPETRS
jgi:hypothetical protein